MANVNPGFKGVATIASENIRCTDFSVNPQQSMLFYDHVIGMNDTIPTGSETKGETPGVIQTQKKYNRPSPIVISGEFSFPATVNNGDDTPNFESIFNYAKYGNYFPITYRHYCKDGREYSDCRISSFNLSVTSGDIVNISAEVHAKNITDISNDLDFETRQKIITWDQTHIDIVEGDSAGFTTNAIQSLELSVNNNLTEVYTAKPNENGNGLLPRDLRLGMQEVTGNIGIYLNQGRNFLDISTNKLQLKLTIAGFETYIYCVLHPKKIDGIVGPVIVSVPFVGVDKAFGV